MFPHQLHIYMSNHKKPPKAKWDVYFLVQKTNMLCPWVLTHISPKTPQEHQWTSMSALEQTADKKIKKAPYD